MLTTPRLTIRPFARRDEAEFVRWHTRPANREFKWSGAVSADEARRQFHQILMNNAAGVPTYRAISLNGADQPIGQIALFPNEESTSAALAYLLDEPHWGNGYTTEASRALVSAFLSEHCDATVFAIIPEGHTASERVAAKLGMEPRGREVRNGWHVQRWEMVGELS